jgi:hypothetical protein
MKNRQEAFESGFDVIDFGDAMRILVAGGEVWSCFYAYDTLEDEDGEPTFTTITLSDVYDWTFKELMEIRPFARV